MKTRARDLIGGAGVILCLLWGAQQFRQFSTWQSWRARTSGSIEERLSPAEIDSTAALLRRAVALIENVAPPDYEQAEELLAQAIAKNPQRSDLWMRLSQAQLFQGKMTEARHSLERSDFLDPNWPAQRLLAVHLWRFFGEEERANAIIETISRVGIQDWLLLREAARSLRLAGYSPAEIHRRLDLGRLGPEAMHHIFNELSTGSARGTAGLYHELTPEVLADDGFYLTVGRALRRHEAWEELADLWLRRDPSPHFLHPEESALLARIPLRNAALHENPFPNAFPLGWQRPVPPWALTSWAPPQDPKGGLTLTIERLANEQRGMGWTLYTFLAPAGATLKARLHAVQETPDTLRLKVRVETPGQPAVTVTPQENPEAPGEAVFEVAIPPPAKDALITIALDLGTKATAPNGNLRLTIKSLEIQDAAPEEPGSP